MTPDTIAGRSGCWEVARSNAARPDHHQTRFGGTEFLNSMGTNSGWVVRWADRTALAGAAGKAL